MEDALRIEYEPVLVEARSRTLCEWCGKSRRLEAAHIFGKGHGSGCRLDISCNLCGLCAGPFGCHAAHHHQKQPTRIDLLAIVAKREGVLSHLITAKINLLLATPKEVFRGFRGRKLQEVVAMPVDKLRVWVEDRTIITRSA